MHQSLPELALTEISLATSLAGRPLASPVIINAMTGGAPGVTKINRDLAILAAELDLPMAVGSQTAGLKDPSVEESYRVVREMNPRGTILANLSADATVETAERAVAMIGADLLQVHLNAPQELVMAEGDRDFRGQLDRIGELVRRLSVPVVVKECGFGLSREAVRALYEAGARAVDVSGRGGTNFAWIEAERRGKVLDPGLLGWGIPTAAAVAEVAALRLPDLTIIASGGIRHASEAAKALALGASAVGVAGALLQQYGAGGIEAARVYLTDLLSDLAVILLLTGSRTVSALQASPVVLTGSVGQWCALRGVDTAALARRQERL